MTTDTILEAASRVKRGASMRRPTRPIMSDDQFERAYAPADYRYKQLAAKLDRIIELLESGAGA